MSSQSFVAKMLTPGKAQEGSEGKSGEPPHEGRAVNYVMASTILLLLDWLKGKSTENQRFSHEIWEFPVRIWPRFIASSCLRNEWVNSMVLR